MNRETRAGFMAGIGAYTVWGLLPIYWKTLGVIPSFELLSWRVAGCGIVAWLVILIRRRFAPRSAFTPKTVFLLVAAAFLIAANWGLYIWAVSTNRILQGSLGYYINPLVNVLLGMIFFSESLGKIRLAALLLAFGGVIVMTFAAGVFPWLSIVLALSFGFYGLTVKQLPPEIDSIEVLAWETAILGPIAAVYLGILGSQGEWHLVGFGTTTTVLLLAAGGVTLLPLWLFGVGARRLPLGVLGFLQYIAPTLMLLIGTLIYQEPFGLLRGLAFALVAAALVLYSSTIRDP